MVYKNISRANTRRYPGCSWGAPGKDAPHERGVNGGEMIRRKTKNGMFWNNVWYPSLRSLYDSFENRAVTYTTFRIRMQREWEPREAATTPGTRPGRKATT